MADVFISYSRKDGEFAQRLSTAFVGAKRVVWVDWQNIPRAEDWWREIQLGVEGADAFICIVSEHWLASEICHNELIYARHNNKRVLPLIRQRVEGDAEQRLTEAWGELPWSQRAQDNWDYLRHLNWIFFDDDARFNSEFDALLVTLEADQPHIKAHTRYQSDALEWERSNRNPSFLMSGDNLAFAETWLAQSMGKEPEPTAIQQAYITESRRVEDKLKRQATERERRIRQFRVTAAVLAVIGGLAVATTVTAFNQAVDSAKLAAAAMVAQGEALNRGMTVEAGSTQLAADSAFFVLQQNRVGTLAAGAVVMPPESTTPEPTHYVATLTQVAELNEWTPVEMMDNFDVAMVQVPQGCFYMGSVAGGDEQPIHLQCFDAPFWIDKFEVTSAQYTAIAGGEPPSQFMDDLNPVDSMNWFDARDFCRMRDARLPTEREWEYAARGPDSLTYPWGNTFISDGLVFSRPPDAGPLPVMDADGNPLRPQGASWVGAVDMSGNLWEWVNTRYDDVDFSTQLFDYQMLYPYPYVADDGRESDETAEEFEARLPIYTLRVLRGGAFSNSDSNLRGPIRDADNPTVTNDGNGFRCARDFE
jgi:formylglycine-generating enzyme required for sulfatase activity